jgi:hypothetical protein
MQFPPTMSYKQMCEHFNLQIGNKFLLEYIGTTASWDT